MTQKQLKELQRNPEKFQDAICIQTGTGIVRFGEVMAEFQRDRFKIINPSLLALASRQAPPCPRIWDERTKGASKDSDWAVCLLWLLAFRRRPLRIQVGAFDADQASEVLQIIRSILRIGEPLNRFIAGLIDVQAAKIKNPHTDSVAEILTHDRLGSHGARPDFVLLNELTHQPNPEFAQTLLDNASKMPRCMVAVATNSGFLGEWQAEWKETFQESDRWTVWEHNEPAPWISQADIDEARKRNPTQRYRRLWQGIWTSGSGDAIAEDDIQAAMILDGPADGPEDGYIYCAGVDLGLSRDASAVVVIGIHVGRCESYTKPKQLSPMQRALIDTGMRQDPTDEEFVERIEEPTGRSKVARIKVWRPDHGRISIEGIEKSILRLHRIFNLQCVGFDRWQSVLLQEKLSNEGIQVEDVTFTPANLQSMASCTLEAFSENQLDIFNHPQLISDLRNLKIEEKSYGIRLNAPRGKDGHGDVATALSIALHIAKSEKLGLPQRFMLNKLIAE